MPESKLTQLAAEQGLAVGIWDWAVIVIYVLGIVGLGCWAGLKRKSDEGAGYFLADKSLSWPIIGLALFSTNISTIHLVSLAQAGYDSGLAMGNFEWMAAFTLICLSLFFAPFYLRSKVTTLPDFLEKRYCRPCRDWFAMVSILSAIFIHLGFTLHTGAVVFEGFLLDGLVDNPQQYHLLIIIIIAGITGLYTIIGGLMAVVLTESVQTIVLLVGSICVTCIGYHAVGGWEGMQVALTQLSAESPEMAAKVKNHLTVVRSHGDPSGMPLYAVLLGYPVLGLWYWCADQTIVQRVLGAKDERHARLGPLFAGFIKILPVFIFILPGVMCLALIQQGKLAALPLLPDGSGPDSNHVLARLISGLLPTGLRGVMAAALLAALMSTVSGALNSIATLFSYDLFKRWRPQTSDRTLVTVGRVVTFSAMVAAIIWSLELQQFGSIFEAINTVIGYICPPVTALFIWGVFVKRLSPTAALITAWYGSLLGMALFAIDMLGYWNSIQEFFDFKVPFLMVPVYSFLACTIVLFLASWSIRVTRWVALFATIFFVPLALWAIWTSQEVGSIAMLQDASGSYYFWTATVVLFVMMMAISAPVALLLTCIIRKQTSSSEALSLVWKTPLEAVQGKMAQPFWSDYRVLASLLFLAMLGLYIAF